MRRQSIVMAAALAILPVMASVPTAFAQEFALQVGPPIAGNAPLAKGSLLVVRPGGCADPANAHITATAEGIVNGVRRSVPLKLLALSTPGVHAVPKQWPKGGVWIVNLVGTCSGQTAGAIVSIGSQEKYRRESVTLLPHRATPTEIDASLKALTTGGHK